MFSNCWPEAAGYRRWMLLGLGLPGYCDRLPADAVALRLRATARRPFARHNVLHTWTRDLIVPPTKNGTSTVPYGSYCQGGL